MHVLRCIMFVFEQGPEGVKWELRFASFWAGKMGFTHWDWDFTTGNGTNTLENGNEISLLCEACKSLTP